MYSFKDFNFQISEENSSLLNNFLNTLDCSIGDFNNQILRIYCFDFNDDIIMAQDNLKMVTLDSPKLICGAKKRIELLTPIIKVGKEYLNSIDESHNDYSWVNFIISNAQAELNLFEKILAGDESIFDEKYGGFNTNEIFATRILHPNYK